MARKKGSVYDKLQSMRAEDTARYRNVHDDQQVDRSYMEAPATMKGRLIFISIVCVIIAIVTWCIVGMIEKTGALDSVNAGWNDLFYGRDGVKSDYQYVTIRDETPRLDAYGLQVYDENTGEPLYDLVTTKYIVNRQTGILTDITNWQAPVYTGCYPAYYDAEGRLTYSNGYEDVYDEYGNRVTSAIGGMFGFNTIDGQQPQVYMRLIPQLGVDDPTYLGQLDDYGFVYTPDAVASYFDPDGVMMSGDEMLLDGDLSDPIYISRYGCEPGENRYLWVRLNRGKLVDTTGWRNHERFTDMRPTPAKIMASLLVSLIVYALLYVVMKKNLDVQNAANDPTDINQHHDDSRLQTPEEIQKAYDIFPDVGAHSSVMVSSMISHQAITNKGLKKIRIAKRAKKDIVDEDGDVEIYKGEILRDDDGEPITIEVPLIDTDFTEALFDSSKTLKGKDGKGRPFRRYFDTPGIPYNPGNENLDKLKGYDTVAELINGDWTFPLYEPQRPGGVYVVDTAPVNTMVLAITRAGKGDLARPIWRHVGPNELIA